MITIAPGTEADFENLNPFVLLCALRFGRQVAAAIRYAFYRPDLTADEFAENGRIRLRQSFGGQVVAIAERTAREAVGHKHRTIFVAKDAGRLAGVVIVDDKDAAMPEIRLRRGFGGHVDWLIVGPERRGKGIAPRPGAGARRDR